MSSSRGSAATGFLAFAASCFAALGLFLVYNGLNLVGTIAWGYNDSQPIVYITFGGTYALIGSLAFFAASLAGLRAIVPGRWGKLLKPALGITLAMVASALIALAIAAGLATPDETSEPNAANMLLAGSLLLSLAAGASAIICLRDRIR